MADQTISVDTNHDVLTARSVADKITLLNGATLTIDSVPSVTLMGPLEMLRATYGTVLIDGRNVKEIAYTGNALGVLPLVGSILTLGGISFKVIELLSGDTTSGVINGTVLSGTILPGSVFPTADATFTLTVSTVKVGYLKVFGVDSIWDGSGLSTFRTRGADYEVGIGDGLDNQTFTLPHQGIQAGVYVETGAGTDIYERWIRISTSDPLSTYGVGELGNVFHQPKYTSSLIFGTATKGGVVPLGARVMIPNVHLGTVTAASPGVEVGNDTNTTSLKISFKSTDRTSYDFSHTNFSTVLPNCKSASNCEFNHTVWMSPNSFASNLSLGIDDCIASHEEAMYSTDSTAILIEDSVSPAVTNSRVYIDIYAGQSTYRRNPLVAVGCSKLILDNLHVMTSQKHTKRQYGIQVLECSAAEVTSCTTVDCQGLYAEAGSNLLVKDFKYCDSPVYAGLTNNTYIGMYIETPNTVIDGFTIVGEAPYNVLLYSVGVANMLVHSIGTADNPLDLQGRCTTSIYNLRTSTGITYKHVYFTNRRAAGFLINSSAVAPGPITLENCGNDYGNEIEADASRLTLKGCRGGSGGFNTSTGVDTSSLGQGSLYYHLFTSDTTGKLGVHFQPNTLDEGPWGSYTVSGSPVIDGGKSRMYFPTAGDQLVYTFPFSIKGLTGFQNALAELSGVNTNTLTIEGSVSTNAGYGPWVLTTALPSETTNEQGFNFRIRITATVTSSTTYIDGLSILTTTTLQVQADNAYPLGVTTLKLSGLLAGSVVALFDSLGTVVHMISSSNITEEIEVPATAVLEQHTLRIRHLGAFPIERPYTSLAGTVVDVLVDPVYTTDIFGSQVYNRGDNSTSSLISINGADKKIGIGDGFVTASDLFDSLHEYETSLVGILYESIATFDGGVNLRLFNGWTIERASVTDANASVLASVSSDSGSVLDDTKGNVIFNPAINLTSGDLNAISSGVWGHSLTSGETADNLLSSVRGMIYGI